MISSVLALPNYALGDSSSEVGVSLIRWIMSFGAFIMATVITIIMYETIKKLIQTVKGNERDIEYLREVLQNENLSKEEILEELKKLEKK